MEGFFVILNVMKNKNDLRIQFLKQREALTSDEIIQNSLKITAFLQAIIESQNWSKILVFSPIKNEPDFSRGLFQSNPDRTFGLPVIENDTMYFRHWRSTEPLVRGKYNILEPQSSDILEPDDKTLVFVPALAVDQKGFRIGYGKGYYDQFLKNNPVIHSIAVVFHMFLVKSLPIEPHDKPVRAIVTDYGYCKVN